MTMEFWRIEVVSRWIDGDWRAQQVDSVYYINPTMIVFIRKGDLETVYALQDGTMLRTRDSQEPTTVRFEVP